MFDFSRESSKGSVLDGRRASLRDSFTVLLAKRSISITKVERLKGRLLFRAAVRLVLEYMEWIVEEPEPEEVTADDVISHIKAAQRKKVEKRVLTLEDRAKMLIDPRDRTVQDKARIFEIIKKVRAFRKYSEQIRESLAGVCMYRYFPKGRTIVRQGHEADDLYFVANGQLAVSKFAVDRLTGEKSEVDMGDLNRGDIFGEIAMLHCIPRSATVVSKTSVDLFLVSRAGFDEILRKTLTEAWDVLKDALVHFNYFKSWDEATRRECCVLSRLKEFRASEIVLGDGKGMTNYVHFVLEGECRLIEHMLVRKRRSTKGTMYELYRPDDTAVPTARTGRSGLSSVHEGDKSAKPRASHKMSVDRPSVAFPSKQSETVDEDRLSIITTTLLDVVNEWHEITDIAAALARDSVTALDMHYPSDVHTIFMQICTFHRGACFGLGENMSNRRIVSITPMRCFLVPRYWLLQHNRANIWNRVKVFLDSKYPSKEQLFQEFQNNRRWITYKRTLIEEIVKNKHCVRNTAGIHDVPYSIRISQEID